MVVVVVFGFFAFLSFSSSQVVSSRAAQGEWMSSRQNISWKQLPFQIHHLGSQNIFFLWLKVGFLVKCMASRLQTNNELSSLFQRKKKVFRISARRTTTRPRETCGINVVVVVSHIRSVGAVRTARGDPRELHGARFSFSHFFFFSFPRKEFVGGILVEIRFARVFFSAMWGRETRVIATFWFGFVGCGIGRVIFNQLWWILSFGSHRTRARNSRAYPLIFFIF